MKKAIFWLLCFIISTSSTFGATRFISPNADGEGSIGRTNLHWGTLYVDEITLGTGTPVTDFSTLGTIKGGTIETGAVLGVTTNAGILNFVIPLGMTNLVISGSGNVFTNAVFSGSTFTLYRGDVSSSSGGAVSPLLQATNLTESSGIVTVSLSSTSPVVFYMPTGKYTSTVSMVTGFTGIARFGMIFQPATTNTFKLGDWTNDAYISISQITNTYVSGTILATPLGTSRCETLRAFIP